jgi:ABC-type amino acid transport substrate-binding protein
MFARFLLLLLLFVSGAVQPASARTLAEIRARGYLVIGTSGTAPPYSWVNSKYRLIGYDIDLGEAIGRRLGVPVRWKRIDFRGLMPALASGELDLVMSGARIRSKLRNTFLFSEPYSYEQTVAVTRAGDTGVRSLTDLRGRSVAVVATSFQEDVARETGGYRELLSLPGGADVFLAMHTGHASVGLVGVSAAEHYSSMHLDPIRIVRAGALLAPQGIVIGKSATQLKAAIDQLLEARRANGQYVALYEKHFHRAPLR